jgi:hypothetical protein
MLASKLLKYLCRVRIEVMIARVFRVTSAAEKPCGMARAVAGLAVPRGFFRRRRLVCDYDEN